MCASKPAGDCGGQAGTPSPPAPRGRAAAPFCFRRSRRAPPPLTPAVKIASAKRSANRPALIVIETSTLPIADKVRALKRLQHAGIALLDCPISGTAVRMKEGAWTIFVSGSAGAYRRAKPVFEVFTRNAPYVGAFGNGTKMKFIANH